MTGVRDFRACRWRAGAPVPFVENEPQSMSNRIRRFTYSQISINQGGVIHAVWCRKRRHLPMSQIKVRFITGRGQPFQAWQGSADANEADVLQAIHESPIVCAYIKSLNNKRTSNRMRMARFDSCKGALRTGKWSRTKRQRLSSTRCGNGGEHGEELAANGCAGCNQDACRLCNIPAISILRIWSIRRIVCRIATRKRW